MSDSPEHGVVRLDVEHGHLTIRITGFESAGLDQLGNRWLGVVVAVETSDPVPCRGETYLTLTTADLVTLNDGLSRMLPKHVGGTVKRFLWETTDDEFELSMVWKKNSGRLSGRVESGARQVDLTVTFRDLIVRRPAVAAAVSQLQEVIDQYACAPAPSREP